jgi:hypothetical protein
MPSGTQGAWPGHRQQQGAFHPGHRLQSQPPDVPLTVPCASIQIWRKLLKNLGGPVPGHHQQGPPDVLGHSVLLIHVHVVKPAPLQPTLGPHCMLGECWRLQRIKWCCSGVTVRMPLVCVGVLFPDCWKNHPMTASIKCWTGSTFMEIWPI